MNEDITRPMILEYMNELDDNIVNRMETDDPLHAVIVGQGIIDYMEEKSRSSLDHFIA